MISDPAFTTVFEELDRRKAVVAEQHRELVALADFGGGPEAGTIIALAIDPVAPSTVYAGAGGNSGVFKTTDDG